MAKPKGDTKELNEQECRVLDQFIQEYWNKFKVHAAKYMTEEELDRLVNKLMEGA